MSTAEISDSTPLVTFLPAELHEGKSWYIGYWVLNPQLNKLVRKQIRWNRVTNKHLRRKLGKSLCQKINRQLEAGWNPFIEQEAPRSFETLESALLQFERHKKRELKNGAIRPDSLRSYMSYLRNLRTWLDDNGHGKALAITLTKPLVREFLEEIYLERNNSPRTHNNYLTFLHTLGDFMVKRDFIKANPAEAISKEKEGPKLRQVIPDNLLKEIFQHLALTDPAYLLICQLCYGCMIRRTEMTLLTVGDVFLKDRVILLPSNTTKNKKKQPVTIPHRLIPLLVEHLKNATNKDFLFSEHDFKPGRTKLAPKKVSDTWNRVRKALDFEDCFKWYSLKDTGITHLLEMGVPAIKVRDQARHYDLSITDSYTPRNRGAAVRDIEQVNMPGWAD